MRIATILALVFTLLGAATASAQNDLTVIQPRNKSQIVLYSFDHRYDDRWHGQLIGESATYADAETLAKGLAARDAAERGFSHVIIENLKENQRPNWCTDAEKDENCRRFNISVFYTFTNETESSEGEVLSVEKMKKPLRFVRWKNRFALLNSDACNNHKIDIRAFDDFRAPDCVRHIFDPKGLGDIPAPVKDAAIQK